MYKVESHLKGEEFTAIFTNPDNNVALVKTFNDIIYSVELS